ncbi:MAG: calycin-like domain-containing protein [Muribaculaceae bacterium]
MKNLFTFIMMCGGVLCANAQFQLPNSSFESWEAVEYSSTNGEEPQGWNSFLSGTGSYKMFAGALQLDRSDDAHSGNASARIWARNVLGSIVAQGNITTGCINMSSMTPSDATGNYNYTNYDVDGQHASFTGYPDAVAVWVKAQLSEDGKINVVLHSKGYYQDPDILSNGNPLTGKNEITATVIAKAEKLDLKQTNGKWERIVVPFVYNENVTSRPETMYVLASFSTSANPGVGIGYDTQTGQGDVMLIDDVEMIYNSTLSSLSYDGTSILEDDVFEYDLKDYDYDASLLSYVINSVSAQAKVDYVESEATLYINVYGDDHSEEAPNMHTYIIHFKENSEAPIVLEGALSISMMGSAVAENVPATINITETGNNTCTFLLPNLAVGDIVIGDITLEGVKMTTDETTGITTFEGSQEGMSLMDGQIVADVSLSGTMQPDGSANMTINVLYSGVPITVIFTAAGNSGISFIPAGDNSGAVDVYNISGVKVMESVSRDEAVRSLPQGLYIIGKEKVIVR